MGFTCSNLNKARKENINDGVKENNNNFITRKKTQKLPMNTPELVNKILEDQQKDEKDKKVNMKNKKESNSKNKRGNTKTGVNKNKKAQLSKDKNTIKTIKDKNEPNITSEKIESQITKNKEESEKTIDKKKSYSDFEMSNAYNCVCPDCKTIPIIKEVDFVEELSDFKIKYTCNCKPSNEGQESSSYLINFINKEKPNSINTNFISKDNLEKIIEIVEEKKNETNGLEILEKLCRKLKKYIISISMAPPPADTKFESINFYTTIVGSEVQNSRNVFNNKGLKTSDYERINQIIN